MNTVLDKLIPSMSFARFFAVLSTALMFVWFGGLTLSGASASIFDSWAGAHPILSKLPPEILTYLRFGLGGLQLAVGALIALHAVPGKYKQLSYSVITVLSVGALSLLLTNPVWMKSLGGFPAIGSGQGIIKYVAIAGVALWLGANRHANSVMLLGLILVLGWIGGMKFTGPEADGVYPLLTSSPVFSWWAPVYFDKQMASNIIGVIELITVACLTGWWWNTRVCQVGLLLSAVTFIVTLSFLVSFTPSWTGAFPYLSSAGHFLLKDIVLLAASFCLLAETRLRK